MAHPTRIFKEPDELYEAWSKFKENVEKQANEWLKIDYVGRNGDKVKTPSKVPYTFEGFKRYCREHYGEVEQYFTNQDDYYDDFIGVCRVIKEEIRENQIIGGMLGFFNPSITQRLNNLKEQTENNTTITEVPLFPDVSEDDSDK